MVKNAWLLGVALLAACSGRKNGAAELQGVIELHERQLGFDVQGRLAQLHVQRGQRVEAGQLLAALDDALQRPVRDARAQDAEAAQAQLDLLRSGTREGDVLAAGAPAVILGETRRPYLDVFVAQQDVAGVRVGAPASVRTDATREAFRGMVSDVARATEFTPRYLFSPRERANLVVRVRIDVEDPAEQLHAGVPAFARIDRTAQPAEARR